MLPSADYILSKVRPTQISDQVRLGSTHDGGYVVPQIAIEHSNKLISIGYGHDYNFEIDYLRYKPENMVVIFDRDISIFTIFLDLVKGIWHFAFQHSSTSRISPLIRLTQLKTFVQMRTHSRILYHKKEIVAFSNAPSQIALADILQEEVIGSSVILKIDIEEAEYSALFSILSDNLAQKIVCLMIEFHSIHKNVESFMAILDSLNSNFEISNAHFNNYSQIIDEIPDVVEMTFLRKSLFNEPQLKAKSIPHQLDKPCNPKRSEFVHDFI